MWCNKRYFYNKFILEANKLYGRLTTHKDFKHLYSLAYWNTIFVLTECNQWNLLIAIRFLLCLFSSPHSPQAAPLSFRWVPCSGKCESNCFRFLEARCLCAAHGHWARPSGTYPLGRKGWPSVTFLLLPFNDSFSILWRRSFQPFDPC